MASLADIYRWMAASISSKALAWQAPLNSWPDQAGAALGNSLQPDFAPPQEYRARTEYPLSAVEGLTIDAIEYDRGGLHLQHLAGLFVDKAFNARAYPEHLAAIGNELGVEAEAAV